MTTVKPIYLSPPDVTDVERELLISAFNSNWIAPLGPDVDAFELEVSEFVGVDSAVALSSGTAALHLALLSLDIGANDLVFASTLTFAATVNAIRYVGAQPVLIDSEPRTWNMDHALLEEALETAAAKGQLPKAVVVVDLYGQCAEYERIEPVCARFGVPIIEDAAEALGATRSGRGAGTFGQVAALSFNGNKVITTSGGGMLLTSSADRATRVRYLATQARQSALHYEHTEVGYNYRLSNLLAALGRGQLRRLPAMLERLRSNHERYAVLLGDSPGIQLHKAEAPNVSTHWLNVATIDQAAFGATPVELCEHFARHKIEARPVWKPMHLQPAFKDCKRVGGDVARQAYETGICLPSGSRLGPSEWDRIEAAFRSVPRSSARPITQPGSAP